MPAYIVVDASVAGAWSFNETYTALAVPVLSAIDAHRVIALAPDRFAEELLRICQKKSGAGTGGGVTSTVAWEAFLDVVTSPLYLLPTQEVHERAWQLARLTGLTTHDALYLALAERWGAELWTLDAQLGDPALSAFAPVRDLRHLPFSH